MDFTLSLTHFCETHGPKSVLCTQVLPLECTTCLPPSPLLQACSSGDTLDEENEYPVSPAQRQHITPVLRKVGTDLTLPTEFSAASTTIGSGSEPESPDIERHPLFKHNDTDLAPQFRYGRAQGETCASCSFSAPETVADRLPAGAPGSVKADGKSKNGAPVFRSREIVCMGTSPSSNSTFDSSGAVSNGSAANSYPASSSYNSTESHPESCHDHTFTYLTAKSPSDPDTYSALRASVIRTLSCEMLPRGMSDGPLCFGDSVTGYTIAYIFRLTDPKARGRRRCYAFLALAGTDASRAFRACPMLWEAFASMAKSIEGAATRAVEEKERKEEQERQEREDLRTPQRPASGHYSIGRPGGSGKSTEKVSYTPVSSFLTQRAVEPDGMMRRGKETVPRSLAEIVGDETIFAILHKYFVALLHCLGDRFGGVPVAGAESVYQTVADADGLESTKPPARMHNERVQPSHSIQSRANGSSTKSRPSADSTEQKKTRSPQKAQVRPAASTDPMMTNSNMPIRPKQSDSGTWTTSSTARAPSPRTPAANATTVGDEIERAKKRLSKTLSLSAGSGPCAPLQITPADARGQVQVQVVQAGHQCGWLRGDQGS